VKVVDLFAGCGGLSLGFQNAKSGGATFDIVAAYDAWDLAVQNYAKNFSHPICEMDLHDVDAAVQHVSRFAPDIIIGGPPCQDFSHAGKRNERSNASLTLSFAKIVAEIRPTWFLMENVDRAQKSRAFQDAKKVLEAAGYGLTESVVDASRCGVPQRRRRLFCIGRQGERDNFINEAILRKLSPTRLTLREYLGDELGVEHFYRHPRNYSRRAVFSIDEPAPTVRGVNRPVPKGYPGHKNDTECVKTMNVRPLTTEERARIQTFPKEYQWHGTKTDREQLIGNAVPVKLGEFMAMRILEFENEKKKRLRTEARRSVQVLIREEAMLRAAA
jgi:DNA (cytosine-5)-methyltransferase 1